MPSGYGSGFDRGFDPSSSQFKKSQTAAGLLWVAGAFILVILGVFILGPQSGDPDSSIAGIPIKRAVTDSDVISLAIGNTPSPKAGQPYEVSLVVYNASKEVQKVSTLSVSSDYLTNGVSVVGADPVQKVQSVTKDGLTYGYADLLDSYDTALYVVKFQANTPGTYKGTIKVCFDFRKCAEDAIETRVTQ